MAEQIVAKPVKTNLSLSGGIITGLDIMKANGEVQKDERLMVLAGIAVSLLRNLVSVFVKYIF